MKAAVLREIGKPLEIENVEINKPKSREVLIRTAAAGVCHSDLHFIEGLYRYPMPVVLGHESAGVVEAVGPEVHSVKPGDHVITCLSAFCGRCEHCLTGHLSRCQSPDVRRESSDEPRLTKDGQNMFQFLNLSSFAEQMLIHENACVKIRDDMPLDRAALIGCGVTTGFGSAVNTAEVRPGDTVAIVGVGGIGAAAIQGARIAGAEQIIAIDPVPWKLDQAKIFGATHGAASMAEAVPLIQELTRGVMADKAILTVGVAKGEHIGPLMSLVRKGGITVVTAVANWMEANANLNLFELTIWQKQVRGSLYGESAPQVAVPQLLNLYRRGLLQLDEMVTRRYSLDQVQEGYDDMHAGRNIRGLITYD
jgi:S-(hydroxymethyl)glutathione dehydrogenase / alcohol dehydrogenase